MFSFKTGITLGPILVLRRYGFTSVNLYPLETNLRKRLSLFCPAWRFSPEDCPRYSLSPISFFSPVLAYYRRGELWISDCVCLSSVKRIKFYVQKFFLSVYSFINSTLSNYITSKYCINLLLDRIYFISLCNMVYYLDVYSSYILSKVLNPSPVA